MIGFVSRLRGRQYQGDSFQHAFKTRDLAFQVLDPATGNSIHADPPIRSRLRPLRLQVALFQQPLKGGVKRAFFHSQQIVRHLLDALRESIAVQRLEQQDLENHHLQCAWEQVSPGVLLHLIESTPRFNALCDVWQMKRAGRGGFPHSLQHLVGESVEIRKVETLANA
jgi:hypothetical protein